MNNLLRLEEGEARIVTDDPWTLVRDTGGLLPSGPLMLPLTVWLHRRLEHEPARDAVWLGPDDEVENLKPWLKLLPLIALDFPSFRDGRAYSQAYLLRTRLGWLGELRAVGDVLRDQLSHMRQCGFDSFAVREDKSVEDALKGLAGMSVLYGRSVIEPRPLFRRR
ncbi:DUF934 domain-containing protein [Pseudomonas sp. N3-W]|uniref:DUF934 domain-containing protein n=1 Tax=Pseudomonas fungipugnans TaxID=3024217 RepID=A0ABT6QXA8_9PSED|nr:MULTISPECIES: DUF934 domain-containing protein [unclassified Pseudomonas]MDI2595541.1 DUF934 domain-containing protein [Pseudomonas sp. 681]UWF46949.1 DUF934 domain-containing protein [Pseudomonas sp. N3-W]